MKRVGDIKVQVERSSLSQASLRDRRSVADLDVPPWPRRPVGLGKDDSRLTACFSFDLSYAMLHSTCLELQLCKGEV